MDCELINDLQLDSNLRLCIITETLTTHDDVTLTSTSKLHEEESVSTKVIFDVESFDFVLSAKQRINSFVSNA